MLCIEDLIEVRYCVVCFLIVQSDRDGFILESNSHHHAERTVKVDKCCLLLRCNATGMPDVVELSAIPLKW